MRCGTAGSLTSLATQGPPPVNGEEMASGVVLESGGTHESDYNEPHPMCVPTFPAVYIDSFTNERAPLNLVAYQHRR